MIPVFQTRFAAETFGNCYEACLATILEVPLSTIPDRAQYVDQDAWASLLTVRRREGADLGELELPVEYDRGEAELARWLRARGIVALDLSVLDLKDWLAHAESVSLTWIARTGEGETSHATVWKGRRCVHNPMRGHGEPSGKITNATLLIADRPAVIARKLGPLLLPDLETAIEATA